MNKRRNVNIVVAGDPGVGKTSLILAAATEAFPDHPVPTLPPTSLPGELTPDGVPSTVVDTSSRPEDRPTLEEQCRKADVILLLWSKESSESLQRLREHWLPFLRLLGVSVPIVLVGARQDLAAQKEKHTLQQAITPLMTQFKEIEVCLECSAKKLQFVGDVFYYAIKAVVHPTAPLFDTYSNQLRPACSKALRRIFTLCDADRDGVLSDSELNAFQVHCWKTPLTPSELDGIKKVVADKMPAGVSNNGLTISGFVYLHSLFIQRGRIETTWAVLRSYGYDDDLTLKDEILDSVSFAASPDQVVELTDTAREFLGSCFQSCDQDRDGALSAHELELVFSTAPFNPWALPEWDRVLAETGSSGALTFKGFLAKWAYMTMKEPRTSLANILYLGYRGDPSQLFCLSKRRRQERKSDPGGRSILQCYVLGSRGAGKSTLVRGLVGIPAGAAADGAAHDHLAAVGTVDGPASRKTVAMQEVPCAFADKMLASSSREECGAWLSACDVAVFVFDSSSTASFREARRLMLQMATASGDVLPCILVAAKDDLGMSQDLAEECREACASLLAQRPVAVSLRTGEANSIYSRVLAAAAQPGSFVPETPSLKATRQYQQTLRKCLIYAGAGIAGWAACYAVYSAFFKKKES